MLLRVLKPGQGDGLSVDARLSPIQEAPDDQGDASQQQEQPAQEGQWATTPGGSPRDHRLRRRTIELARLLIPLLLIPLWWIGLRLTKRLPHHRWWGDVGHRLLLSGW